MKKRVLVTGNSGFSLVNFRLNFILYLVRQGFLVSAMVPKDANTMELEKSNVACNYIFMKRKSINPIYEFITLLDIARKIIKIKPHIIFSYTIKNCVYVGLVRRFIGFKFYPTITGLGSSIDRNEFFANLIRYLYKLSLRKSEKIFCQNKEIRDFLVQNHIATNSKCIVVPGSGVDIEKYSYTPIIKDKDETKFLFIGRILESKGIGKFIDAATLLNNSGVRASYKIIGGKETEDPDSYFDKMMIKIYKEKNIEYMGFKQNVVPDIQAAHCVVLPSTYREGVPRVLLESASIGRALITADRPGCREVVEDGLNGFLIKEVTSLNLAKVMRKICELDANEVQKFGAYSRKIVQQRFDERLVVEAYSQAILNDR